MSARAQGKRAGGSASLSLHALAGLPEIQPGDDLARIIAGAMAESTEAAQCGDVLCVSHKIVSKAENRYCNLEAVQPCAEALALATATGKDPRLVQIILDESCEILRHRDGLIIARHNSGAVMANAGIDQSNLSASDGERVLRLPADADASARSLRGALSSEHGIDVAVVICDSVGRAWRRGVVGQALGVAGLPALRDLRGELDRQGRELQVTYAGFADQIASAAELLMGEAAEGRPVVLIRGLRWSEPALPAQELIRTAQEDLFR